MPKQPGSSTRHCPRQMGLLGWPPLTQARPRSLQGARRASAAPSHSAASSPRPRPRRAPRPRPSRTCPTTGRKPWTMSVAPRRAGPSTVAADLEAHARTPPEPSTAAADQAESMVEELAEETATWFSRSPSTSRRHNQNHHSETRTSSTNCPKDPTCVTTGLRTRSTWTRPRPTFMRSLAVLARTTFRNSWQTRQQPMSRLVELRFCSCPPSWPRSAVLSPRMRTSN